MRELLAGVIELVALFVANRRGVFWAMIIFIVIGLEAVAANFMEPGRPSF